MKHIVSSMKYLVSSNALSRQILDTRYRALPIKERNYHA
jgi:hypothetical protein